MQTPVDRYRQFVVEEEALGRVLTLVEDVSPVSIGRLDCAKPAVQRFAMINEQRTGYVR